MVWNLMGSSRSRAMLAAIAAAAGLLSPAPASACQTRPSGSHWYGVSQKANATGADRGAAATIAATSLATTYPNIVTHELWYGVTGSGSYWVEVGVIDGYTQAGTIDKRVFWADNRNGGGFHEHISGLGWTLGGYYQAKVVWAGTSCAWDVSFAGTHLGTSTGNCGGSYRYLASGLEASSATSTDHVGGYSEKWARKDGSSNWHYDWESPVHFAYCPADINVYSGYTEEVLHGPI
jgi:hypothetical protein